MHPKGHAVTQSQGFSGTQSSSYADTILYLLSMQAGNAGRGCLFTSWSVSSSPVTLSEMSSDESLYGKSEPCREGIGCRLFCLAVAPLPKVDTMLDGVRKFSSSSCPSDSCFAFCLDPLPTTNYPSGSGGRRLAQGTQSSWPLLHNGLIAFRV